MQGIIHVQRFALNTNRLNEFIHQQMVSFTTNVSSQHKTTEWIDLNLNDILYLQQILKDIGKFVLPGFHEIFVTGDQMFPERIQRWIDGLQSGKEFLETAVFETRQNQWLDEHTWGNIFLESQQLTIHI